MAHAVPTSEATPQRPPLVSSYQCLIPGRAADVYRAAAAVPVSRLLRGGFRVVKSTAGPAGVRAGDTVDVAFGSFPVPIRFTRVAPFELAYDYLPGGISTGTNRITFEPRVTRTGEEATLVTHTSIYRITNPFLRALPFVYWTAHWVAVKGMMQGVREAVREAIR